MTSPVAAVVAKVPAPKVMVLLIAPEDAHPNGLA